MSDDNPFNQFDGAPTLGPKDQLPPGFVQMGELSAPYERATMLPAARNNYTGNTEWAVPGMIHDWWKDYPKPNGY